MFFKWKKQREQYPLSSNALDPYSVLINIRAKIPSYPGAGVILPSSWIILIWYMNHSLQEKWRSEIVKFKAQTRANLGQLWSNLKTSGQICIWAKEPFVPPSKCYFVYEPLVVWKMARRNGQVWGRKRTILRLLRLHLKTASWHGTEYRN